MDSSFCNIYLFELAIRRVLFLLPEGASCRLLRSNTISTRAVGKGMSHLFGVMQIDETTVALRIQSNHLRGLAGRELESAQINIRKRRCPERIH